MKKKSEQDKIDLVLEDASTELEGDNRHSMVGLPEELYARIADYISAEDKLKVARIVAKAITDFVC